MRAKGGAERVRVVVCDDHPTALEQLISILMLEFDVLGKASNGPEAIEVCRKLVPNALVLDLQIPLLNGIEVARELLKMPKAPAIVICSAISDPEIIEAVLETGALGYVVKSRARTDLIPAVRTAVSGRTFVSRLKRGL